MDEVQEMFQSNKVLEQSVSMSNGGKKAVWF